MLSLSDSRDTRERRAPVVPPLDMLLTYAASGTVDPGPAHSHAPQWLPAWGSAEEV